MTGIERNKGDGGMGKNGSLQFTVVLPAAKHPQKTPFKINLF
jgi:hypothetical protein